MFLVVQSKTDNYKFVDFGNYVLLVIYVDIKYSLFVLFANKKLYGETNLKAFGEIC